MRQEGVGRGRAGKSHKASSLGGRGLRRPYWAAEGTSKV